MPSAYYQYLFTIKNDNIRKVDIISSIMAIVGLLAILYIRFGGPVIHSIKGSPPNWIWIFSLAALLGLGYNWFQLYKNPQKKVWFRPIMLFLAIPCFFFFNAIFGLVFILLSVLERYTKKPMEIGISEKHIAFNTFPKRIFNWSEISNVILRDELLTIDFANNRIIQKQINTDGNDIDLEKDVDVFNDFCKAQISIK